MSTYSPGDLLERFKFHLNEIVHNEDLYDLMGLSQASFDPEAPINLLMANNINLGDFVSSISWEGILAHLQAYPNVGQAGGRRLVVAPCSPLFASLLDSLAQSFAQICFVDTNRSGLSIGDHPISHPDQVEALPDDVCLILTRNTDACAYYERKFGRENTINWLRDYILRLRHDICENTPSFLASMNASKKPILFVSARPMATLNSTITKLYRDGFSTFWLGSEEVKEAHQTGYAIPKVTDLTLTGFNIGGLADFIYTFTNMEHGLSLYHYETIYPPAWDFQRIAICYAGTIAMIRTVKECRPPQSTARFGLYMYDAIKPGVKNYHAGAYCGRLYKLLVSEAEALVYSSFTDDFGDFVENAVGKKLPRVHHHRYQTVPSKRKPRLKDGYHIAVISVLLEDFWEPSRMGLIPYVRNMIQQGLHIHYYAAHNSQEKVHQFIDSLPDDQKHLFHIHKPIHDLEALANELSQYHVGWSLFQMQIFSDMIANLDDQFTRDAMDMFTPTTLPSVIWSCAAAGLPIVCNRSMRAVVDLLPPGLAIPLSLSELHLLHEILDRIDWTAIDQIPLESLDISNHIHKLYAFLEDYYVT